MVSRTEAQGTDRGRAEKNSEAHDGLDRETDGKKRITDDNAPPKE